MPDSDIDFEFAEFAITTPETDPLLQQRLIDVRNTLRPDNILEGILASEIIHAGWEMERVRQLAHHHDAEPLLSTANARASRNWHRARKFLKKLQTAEASRYCGLIDADAQDRAKSFPLADLNKLPKPFSLEPSPAPEDE